MTGDACSYAGLELAEKLSCRGVLVVLSEPSAEIWDIGVPADPPCCVTWEVVAC